MPRARFLAIEWDRHELRGVVAEVRGKRRILLRNIQASLPEDATGADDPQSLGTAIGQALRDAGVRLRGAQVVVLIDRGLVELRALEVPLADEEQLPEVVWQQAAREFTSLNEESALDFVPIAENDEEETQLVVAAAASDELLRRLRETWQHAGLEPVRLGLRSFSAGALLSNRRGEQGRSDVVLLVDPQAEHANLTVIAHGRVVLSRSVRLPGQVNGSGSAEREEALLAEIRRTQIAVQNTPPGEPISRICVWSGTCPESLKKRISDELSFEVESVDPLAGWTLDRRFETQAVRHIGRLAPLIGAIEEEIDGSEQRLDFLHPREPLVPQNHRMRWLAVAAAVVAIAAGIGFMGWRQIAELDRQVAQLRREANGMKRVLKKAAAQQEAAQTVAQWVESDVVWLDELRYLSVHFPEARDAVLLRLSMARSSTGAAGIDMQGLVREPSLVEKMENALRDARHEVRSKRGQQVAGDELYSWKFDSAVVIRPSANAESSKAPKTTRGRQRSRTR